MAKGMRYSIIPTVAALAALFIVLPKTGAGAEVTMIGDTGAWRFEPAALEVEPGARVAFVNETGATHTADCVGCPWSTGDVQPEQTRTVVFRTEGVYPFGCRYHPDLMTGTLIVGTPPPGSSPSPSPTST
jgi:plastocyanin